MMWNLEEKYIWGGRCACDNLCTYWLLERLLTIFNPVKTKSLKQVVKARIR